MRIIMNGAVEKDILVYPILALKKTGVGGMYSTVTASSFFNSELPIKSGGSVYHCLEG